MFNVLSISTKTVTPAVGELPAFPVAAQISIAIVAVVFVWIVWKTWRTERQRMRARGPQTHSNAHRAEHYYQKEMIQNGGLGSDGDSCGH